jgi:hypothetical protein
MVPAGIFDHRTGKLWALARFCVEGAPYGGLIGSVEDAARFARLHLGVADARSRSVLLVEASATRPAWSNFSRSSETASGHLLAVPCGRPQRRVETTASAPEQKPRAMSTGLRWFQESSWLQPRIGLVAGPVPPHFRSIERHVAIARLRAAAALAADDVDGAILVRKGHRLLRRRLEGACLGVVVR